jgi:hypothetical protein
MPTRNWQCRESCDLKLPLLNTARTPVYAWLLEVLSYTTRLPPPRYILLRILLKVDFHTRRVVEGTEIEPTQMGQNHKLHRHVMQQNETHDKKGRWREGDSLDKHQGIAGDEKGM